MNHPILKAISEVGVVAVIRAKNTHDAMAMAQACIEGGVTAIEITFTVSNADQVIHALSEAYQNSPLILGAGTVLNRYTAEVAIHAGAKFIVSPGFDLDTATFCQSLGIPYLPGCLTPTEIMQATNAGCEVIKLFPGSAFGPEYVKAIKGPFPQVNIMPTGGVSLDNVDRWIKHGVIAVGVGSELTGPASKGDFQAVSVLAKAFVDAVKLARKQ